MTASTEQEHALADLRHMYAQMVGGMVKDSAQAKRIADGILSRAIQKLEQAARRAPAVAVPQGLFEAIEHGDEKHRAWLKAALTEFFAGKPIPREVAAAPQPPEAAPVQLPEPQAEIEVRSMKTYLDLSIHEWRDTLPDGAYNIYTEQQLRELLAAHGIQE